MKSRNFYLFVALLAGWMAWAMGIPAWVLALAGHDDYSIAVTPAWTPEVELAELDVDERTATSTGEEIVNSIVLRKRIGDRIAETMGGFHWHGPVTAIASVRTTDGALLRYRMTEGSNFAEYVDGESRKANGDLLEDASIRRRSACDAG